MVMYDGLSNAVIDTVEINPEEMSMIMLLNNGEFLIKPNQDIHPRERMLMRLVITPMSQDVSYTLVYNPLSL